MAKSQKSIENASPSKSAGASMYGTISTPSKTKNMGGGVYGNGAMGPSKASGNVTPSGAMGAEMKPKLPNSAVNGGKANHKGKHR